MIISLRQPIRAIKITVAVLSLLILLTPMIASAERPSWACFSPDIGDGRVFWGCVCSPEECDNICEQKAEFGCKFASPTAENPCTKTCSDEAPVITGGSQSFKPKVLENPLTVDSIPKVIGRAIQIFTGVSGSVALLMFVYGSFLLMTSRGEPEKVKKGKDAMKMAVLGLIIIFTAYAVLNLLFESIGAS